MTDLQKRIQAALADPQNMGETGGRGFHRHGRQRRLRRDAAPVGEVQAGGRQKVIDRATFQSFGCETAIAVASLATELIRGKTAEEALALKTEEFARELGPLPPMKIHCAQLVEGALRSALDPQTVAAKSAAGGNEAQPKPAPANAPTLNRFREFLSARPASRTR